jgi:cysteine desulfurase
MIYFDNNATTRINPEVLEAMMPYFNDYYANASSTQYKLGLYSKNAVELAREQIAETVKCDPSEIIFTSGATESINSALSSIIEVYGDKRKKIITLKTEHKAVLDTLCHYETKGFELIYIDVDLEGIIQLDQLESYLDESVLMICVMLANNETGVIQPISKISTIAKAFGVIVMSDIVQGFGKLPIDLQDLNIDLAPVSAHKFHGPKGVGALYVRRKSPRIQFQAMMKGGGHERNRRSGTLNVPGIVGMGKAAEIAEKNLWDNMSELSKLRNHFEHQLLDDPIRINGSTKYRLCNTSNIQIIDIPQSMVFRELSDIAFSLGSACSTELLSPSHVLTAMGMSDETIKSSYRFSFGVFNTINEIDFTIKKIKALFKDV